MAIVTENRTGQYPGQSMKELVSDRWCLNLLRFFSAHPNSRFSKLAIVHATDEDGSRLRVEKALARLVEKGVLETNNENNTCLYLLTRDGPARQMVLNMAELDWRQWQKVLEHSKPDSESGLGSVFSKGTLKY